MTFYNDSFDTDSNVFRTVDPLNQADTFDIDSNIFRTADPINQWDTFDVDSYTAVSTSSNTITFQYILTGIEQIIPDPAPLPGGVTIVGTMLDKVTGVWMDGNRASFRILSDTQIHATIPTKVSSTTVEVYLDYEF